MERNSVLHKEILKKFDGHDLDELSKKCLETLACDPHGIERLAAASMLAGATGASIEACSDSVQGLLGAHLLLLVDGRLQANYALLGIDADAKAALQSQAQPSQSLGSPHSQAAMSSLREWMVAQPGAIYLGMGISSHKVFGDALALRASAGRTTIFVLPPRGAFPPSRHDHYDEIIAGWIKYIREGDRTLKSNIRLIISPEMRPYLYTSGIAQDKSRFDVYWTNFPTTRNGEIIEAKPSTSLYDLVKNEYADALEAGTPLFRLWPIDYLCTVWRNRRPAALGFLLISAGTILAAKDPYVSGLLGSSGITLILQQALERKWQRSELFRR